MILYNSKQKNFDSKENRLIEDLFKVLGNKMKSGGKFEDSDDILTSIKIINKLSNGNI